MIVSSREMNVQSNQKKAPRAIESPPQAEIFIAFRDAIIAYHYLNRNPKFAMETVS